MLDYTKAAIAKIKDDLNRLIYIANLSMQLVYIAYLVYAILAGAGNTIANIVLFGISVAYLAFFLFITLGKTGKLKQKTKKLVTLIYKRSKQLVKLFTLGVMIYGIYTATATPTPASVIFSALMIVSWLLPIALELLQRYFSLRIQLLIEGLSADIEVVTKPVKTVGNFFKKISGKEIEPEKEKTKARLWLDERVAEVRADRNEQKRDSKASKKQAKRQAKLDKKQAKLDKKNTVFLPEAEQAQAPDATPQAVEVLEETPSLE